MASLHIVPVDHEDDLTTRICKGLEEVKKIKEGILARRTITDMLEES